MGKDGQAAGEPRGVQEEHLTEDLLARLLSSSTPEEYLREPGAIIDRSLASYVTDLLRSRGLKRADVVRASGLNGTFVYDIFAGKSKPGRDHAIMLAVGLGCNLRETQRLLRLAGVSELWPKVRRDAIIIWCIQHRYDRFQIDDELWHMDEQTLFHTGPLRGGRCPYSFVKSQMRTFQHSRLLTAQHKGPCRA